MHKLTVLRSTPMIQELMRRLEDESIEALAAQERGIGEIYSGLQPSVGIWIAEAEHLDRAAQILGEVQAQRTFAHCPQCDYDLRGHRGRSTCPECGRDLTAPAPDVACPECGEPVPAGFDVCWNCRGRMPAPTRPRPDDPAQHGP